MPRVSDKRIIEALKETRGTILVAARRLGIDRTQIYRRMPKNPKIGQVIEEAREWRVDKAELKLEAAVDAGEGWAIALTLTTLGKKRGYVRGVEVGGEDGKPVPLDVTVRFAETPAGTPEPRPTEP